MLRRYGSESEEEEDGVSTAARDKIFEKGQSKRIWGELYKVVDSSDVVVQVFACTCFSHQSSPLQQSSPLHLLQLIMSSHHFCMPQLCPIKLLSYSAACIVLLLASRHTFTGSAPYDISNADVCAQEMPSLIIEAA